MSEEDAAEQPAGEPVETQGGDSGQGLTEEELAMLEQQMRELTVDDLLTQTVVSVLNLTALRISKEDEIDLDQASTGIEAVRVLLPLLPEEIAKEIREPLSQVQMLYASRSGGEPQSGTPSEGTGGSGAESAEQTTSPGQEPSGGEDRPESGLWTPPGT